MKEERLMQQIQETANVIQSFIKFVNGYSISHLQNVAPRETNVLVVEIQAIIALFKQLNILQ